MEKKVKLPDIILPASPKPSRKIRGTLIVIGGGEDKTGDMIILKECAKRIRGKLIIASVASFSKSEELWQEYHEIFKKLGVKEIEHLSVTRREQSLSPEQLKLIEGAKAFFFTGGDQLRITSDLGGTMLDERMHEIYRHGGLIAGTSAGASVMGETMLIAGSSETSRANTLKLGAGLGFVPNVIIDQHFAERGRIGRLLVAVAQNPKLVGVGIDENTALIVESGERFSVIGSGAVYIVDGHETTNTNICDAKVDGALSLFDVRLHLLSSGDSFEFQSRRPTLYQD